MFLEQHYLGCLSHASYLIGDEGEGRAVVVDPQRDIDRYLDAAKKRGVEITDVYLTHFHADFVSGHIEFLREHGVTLHVGRAADAEYEFKAAADGDTLTFGSVKIEVLETPGHTPESICLLVTNTADETAPQAILTGDTLFIGDVGRPDLMASSGVTQETLAGWLYDSIHGKILSLPDSTLLYPAHGAGSACGKSLSKETVSTLGKQRQFNYALQPMTREEFITRVTADLAPAPSYFAYDAALNRQNRETLGDHLERSLRPLAWPEFHSLANDGAQVLDVRDPDSFAERHVKDSLNIGLNGRFATWAGTMLDRDRPIVIVCAPNQEAEAAMRLGRIGYSQIAGFLQGGVDGAPSDHHATTSRWDSERLADEQAAATILDIRTTGERENFAITPSVHIPLPDLADRRDEVPNGSPLLVVCAGGYRSSIGASLLRQAGRENVVDLIGGMTAWQASRNA